MSRSLKTTLTIEAQTKGADKINAVRKDLAGLGADAANSNPEVAKLRTTLGELANQQRLISQFTQMKAALAQSSAAMKQAQTAAADAARTLREKQAATQAATQAQQTAAAALAKAKDHHAQLRGAVAGAVTELKQLQAQARAAGGASGELGQRISVTRGMMGVLRTEAAKAGAAVKTLAAEHGQLSAALRNAEAAQKTAQGAFNQAVDVARRSKTAFEQQRVEVHNARRAMSQAGMSAAELAAAQRRVAAETAAAAARLAQLRASMAQTESGANRLRGGIESISTQLARIQQLWIAWQTAMATASGLRNLANTADLFKNIEARLRLVNEMSGALNISMAETADLARRTYSGLDSTSKLLASLARAGAELGTSQETVVRLTETINKANQLSGQSAAAADAAVIQLIQGLQSGVLRGEEFNSMMEQAPRLAKALADGLDVPVSALRAMAKEGQLTTEVIIAALSSQAAAVDREFNQLPLTIAGALTNFSTAWTMFLGSLDKSSGVSTAVATSIEMLADNLDMLGSIVGTVASLVIAQFGVSAVLAIKAYVTTLITATGATGTLAVASGVMATAVSGAWAVVMRFPWAIIIAGAYQVGRGVAYMAENWDELTASVRTYLDERKKQNEAEANAEANQARISERLAEISQRTGVVVTTMAELNAAHKQGKIHYDASTLSWQAGADALQQVAAKASDAKRQAAEVGKALANAASAFEPVAEAATAALTKVQQALDQAKSDATAAATGIGDAYASMSEGVAGALEDQVAAIKSRYEQERDELESSSASRREKISEGARLLAEALAEETAARAAATAETLRLIDEESAARIRAVEAQADTDDARALEVRRVENDILATRKSTLAALLDAYRQNVNALNAELNRHLAAVTALEKEKRQLTLDTEERIRELRRGSMTEERAMADRKKEIAELQAKARTAIAKGEFDEAREFGKKAMALATEVASEQTRVAKEASDKQGEYATATIAAKGEVNRAIRDILASETLVKQAIDAESKAHKQAAQDATQARDSMQGAITETERQVQALTDELSKGLKLTLDADTTKLTAAIDDVTRLLEEKAVLVKIDADMQAAEARIEEYEALLKAGKDLPVGADFTEAQAALDQFADYAKTHGRVKLGLDITATKEALNEATAAIGKLNELKTVSSHDIDSNVDAARRDIDSLNGRNTSSTHTINVVRVEQKAAGGPVGGARQRFAAGGQAMSEGPVPGVGDTDSVARTLPEGAFVLRKAAVAFYGRGRIAEMIAGARGTAAPTMPAGNASPGVRALLMPGEHVISPRDVARLGLSFFEGLNAMALPPEPLRFAEGGAVKAMDLGGTRGILARAEQLGGIALRKRIEADWARQRRKFSLSPQRAAQQYADMLKRTVAMLDGLQSRQERQQNDGGSTRQQYDAHTDADDDDDSSPRARSSGMRAGGSGAPTGGAGSAAHGGAGVGNSGGSGSGGGAGVSARSNHIVTIQLGGVRTEIGMHSEQDSNKFMGLLRELERARGVAQ